MFSTDKRFQIFISSTFKDLGEQRKQAIEVIFEQGHIPIALDRFSPSNESDLAVIKKVISECQIYILILGHRYGELVPGEDISFTELEYNLAEKFGLTILAFVLDKNELDDLRKNLEETNEEDRKELDNRERLIKFRSRIKRFRKIWRLEHQFKYFVGSALLNNISKCKLPGFIKEAEEPTRTLLVNASRNEFIVDIVEQLKNFELLYERCTQETSQKKKLSEQFREEYLDKIIKNKVSLFFESGSTVAYVAREISNTLSKVVKIKGTQANIHISTNNVLAFLQFWLNARIPCTTFPWSPPTGDSYGAIYGALDKIEQKKPIYDCDGIDEYARKEIDRLKTTPYTITELKRPTLILATASGLQTDPNNHDLKFPDDVDPGNKKFTHEQVSCCLGPHVGSYKNKIFKRFLYEVNVPIMFFITGSKINRDIEIGRCHFIHDKQFTWEKFYNNYPVSFCVGSKQKHIHNYINIFDQLGFQIIKGNTYLNDTSFIARNLPFIEKFESKLDI